MTLTVSNRRGEEDDTSGHYLRDSAQEAGHHVVDKAIVKENRYAIRAQVSAWIASDDVQVVLITGGTGLTEGDQAPEALLPLFDREVEGFGEVFWMLSFEEIGTSTLQSRAVAGVANKTLIFAMPGSTKCAVPHGKKDHRAAAGCPYASVQSPSTFEEVSMSQLTHINAAGEAHMVDVSAKAETVREARAEAFVTMRSETLAMIIYCRHHKGDVFATARIAGIQAAKRTWI